METQIIDKYKAELILRIDGVWTPKTVRNCGEMIKENLVVSPKFKNLYMIYSEMAFNMMLHCEEREEHDGDRYGVGVFELWGDESAFYFITKNRVSKEQVDKIVERANHINSLDRDDLVSYYREQRRESAESNREGGNIGLIDIVRKSKNPLKITTIEYSEDYIELELEAKVNK